MKNFNSGIQVTRIKKIVDHVIDQSLELAIGRVGPANSGLGQNRVRSNLTRIFRTKILAAQPALKTGLVGPNSLLKAKKKKSGRSGRVGPYWAGPNLARFFFANNLMA